MSGVEVRGGSWGAGFQPLVWRDRGVLLTLSGTEQKQAESFGPRHQTSPTHSEAEPLSPPPCLLPPTPSKHAQHPK